MSHQKDCEMRKWRAFFLLILILSLSKAVNQQKTEASPLMLTFAVNSTDDDPDATPGDGTCASALGDCTLRAAVQEANAFAGPDTITLPGGGGNYNLINGELPVSQPLTITGAGNPIIDAGDLSRIFNVTAAVAFTLDGVFLEDGNAGAGFGGGIFAPIAGSNITLINSRIQSSVAARGGGLYVEDSSLSLTSCILSTNVANGIVINARDGGGLYFVDDSGAAVSLLIDDTVITGNQSNNSEAGMSVFLLPGSAANVNVTFSNISGNVANVSRGAGIIQNDGTGTVNISGNAFLNTAINGNTATTGSTGGMVVTNGTLTDVTIDGNTAGTHTGGLGTGNTVTLIRTTVSNNTANSDGGGGIRVFDGTLTLDNSLVDNNTAPNNQGGGILSRTPATINLINDTRVINNDASPGSGDGGGIYTQNTSLIATNAVISNNTASDFTGGAGGIYFYDDSANPNVLLSLTNTVINGNIAQSGAGGLVVQLRSTSDANIILDSVTISNNSAGSSVGGASIENLGSGTAQVQNSLIISNTADRIGGFAAINATFQNVTIQNNTATNDTGGLWSGGTVQVTNSTIDNNSADGAGGIFVSDGTLTLTNSTISANDATGGNGGGISIFSGATVDVTNSTLSGNTAVGSGGGIFVGNTPAAAIVTLNHVTLLGNTAPTGGGIFSEAGGTVTISNSIVTNSGAGGDCTGTFTATNNLATGSCGTTAVTNIDATLANNGGPTQTHALQAGSNALDAVAVCTVATDQRGTARTNPCDIGAFELATTPEIQVEDVTGAPVNIADGSTFVFPATTVGNPVNRTLRITNTGTGNLTLTNPITVTGDFSVTAFTTTTLAPLAFTDITLTCSATAAGAPNPVTGTVEFGTDDTDENPFNFDVECTVTAVPAPEIEVEDATPTPITDGGTYNMGTTTTGTAINRIITVRNTGTADLILTQPITVPAGYTATNFGTTTVGPGLTTTFTLTCTAGVAGTIGGTVEFGTDDTDENPFNFDVSCQVNNPAPEIEVLNGATPITDGQAGAVSFGTTTVTTPVDITFTINNTGQAQLDLSNLTVTPLTGFSIVTPPPANIGIGGTGTFTIQCTAAAAGVFNSTVQFDNTDTDENPFNFPITCTVDSPEINVTNDGVPVLDGQLGNVNFANTAQGTPVSETFVVNNTGGANLTLSNLTLPPGFSLVGVLPASIAPAGNANFVVQCDAVAAGDYIGTLQFVTNDPDENPYNFPIACRVLAPGQTDIAVAKTASKLVVAQNETITLTLTATNNGPINATNLQVNDPLPVGMTFVSSNGAYNAGTGIWTIGNLTAFASVNLQIQVQMTGAVGADITNTASRGTMTQTDPDNTNDSASVTIHIARPLTVTKNGFDLSPGTPVQVGDSIGWIICVTNPDTISATNVVVTDTIDTARLNPPTQITTTILGAGTPCPAVAPVAGTTAPNTNGANLNVNLGSLAPGATGVVYFETVVRTPPSSQIPPSFAMVGLLAVGGLLMNRNRRTLLLILLLVGLLVVLPVHAVYAQEDGTTPSENPTPEPPPLPFTEPIAESTPEPTMELPFVTPTPFASETPTAEATATETPVPTIEGELPTQTLIPTETPAILPVETFTPTLEPTADESGWTRYESDDPRIIYSGVWEIIESDFVSGGSYIYTADVNSSVLIEFEGESITFDYLRFKNFGIFEVYLDEVLVALIDGYNLESDIETSIEFVTTPGIHQLRLQNAVNTNPESTDTVLALDALEIKGTLRNVTPATPTPTVTSEIGATTEIIGTTEVPVGTQTPESSLIPIDQIPSLTPSYTPTANVIIVENTPTPVNNTLPVAVGWTRYEMNHPDIEFIGGWQSVESSFVSGGSYAYSTNVSAALELTFEGEAVRFDYLQYWNFGTFEIYLDDALILTIDGYNPDSQIASSAELLMPFGEHTLRIQNTILKAESSQGNVIAIDAIDIKNSTTLPTPLPTATSTPDFAAEGWTRFEMNHPAVQLSGEWQQFESAFVSGGSYSYSEDETAMAVLQFAGESLRVNYLEFSNFGIFEVYLDEVLLATIDGYHTESRGASTAIFNFTPTLHTLKIVNTGRTNGSGLGLALDSIDVREVVLPATPIPPASIGGSVMDTNGEPASDVTLNLYQDDGDGNFDAEIDPLVTSLTVQEGAFTFENLTEGVVYWVVIPEAENLVQTVWQVTAPDELEVVLAEKSAEGEIPTEINGRVFNDNNANREWSGSGESGIRSAKVYLYQDNGDSVFDMASDVQVEGLQVKPDGTYQFDATLAAGMYWIWMDESTLPANYMDTVETGEHGIQNPKQIVIEAVAETPSPTSTEELQVEISTLQDDGETTLLVENADFAYALDTDGDTSPDSLEGSGDRDNDGIPNFRDTFDPSGVVYSVDAANNGNAVTGAVVRLVYDNGGILTVADTVQPNPQTTGANGAYRFDIVAGTTNGLPAGAARLFILEITPPTGYTFPSVTFPPQAGAYDATPPATGQIVTFSHPPNAGQPHDFYMQFTLQQGDNPVVNNHIALDAPPNVIQTLSINNQASARHDNAPDAASNVASLQLNSALNMTLAPNGAQLTSPGQTITYDHTLTNTGTQTDRYTISFPVGTQTGWTQEVRILSGVTQIGTVTQGGTFTLPLANALPPGATLTLRHVVTVPLGTANGTVNTNTITATSVNVPSNGLTRTVTDVTSVQAGCLGGTLFHDVNNNNIRDVNEPVFANARVTITDTVGTTIAVLTTDTNGNYNLGGIPAGIYNARVDTASIAGGAVVFLNPITGQAQLNVAIGGTCVVGNFSLVLVDPALSKIGSVSQARPGETITFTLNLTNPSSSAITNVSVVDPLNGLFTFVSATSTQGTSTFNSTNNTVTFTIGTVAPNASITMTVTVTVSSLATLGTTINNTATLNFAEGPAETSPVVTITIPSPVTPTATATATTVGGGSAGGDSTGGGGGTGSSGGGSADTLPATGYRPLPANTGLFFGLELQVLSAMEIMLALLAAILFIGCIGWLTAQWLAENRSDKLARLLPTRPTPQLIRVVITLTVVSSMVLGMLVASNLTTRPEKQDADDAIADTSQFSEISSEAILPIHWEDNANSQGGFNFAPPQIPASRIIIPRLGVDTMLTSAPLVGTTWDVSELTEEVAHLDGTAHPGTMGNAVLAGHVQHRDGLGPFRNLDQLSQGDLVIAVGDGVEYTYLITDIMTVDPQAIEVTHPSNQPLITLISCAEWDNASWSYQSRIVVRAKFKSWRNTHEEDVKPQGTWRRYEIDGRETFLDGDWNKIESTFTSDGSYVYSRDEDAEVTLSFSGEKLRIHYLYFWEFGMFDVYVDDKKVATIDAYNPLSLVGSSEIIFLEPGRHKLRIVNTGKRNEGSQGTTIALDAIDVYRTTEE